MRLFQLSEGAAARRDVFVQMVDASDYVSPMTSLAVTAEMVKAGESGYSPIAGSVLEIGDGTYRISLAADDLDTEGEAMLKITGTGAVNQYVPIRVLRIFDDAHLAKAALVNARAHTVDTGVNEIRDDDGTTTLRVLTPSESNGVVTIMPS